LWSLGGRRVIFAGTLTVDSNEITTPLDQLRAQAAPGVLGVHRRR